MDDLGGAHILDELLDHGFAGQAEFVDAALDGRSQSSRSSQSRRNSWILRRERRQRSDNAAMKAASMGPTRERSLIRKFRLRPSIRELSPTRGRSTLSRPQGQRTAK